MSQYALGTAVGYRPAHGIPLGVRDLSVVDDDGVPLCPVPVTQPMLLLNSVPLSAAKICAHR
jgi:hypothetical protein